MVFATAGGTIPLIVFCMKKEAHQKPYYLPRLLKPIGTRQSSHAQILREYHVCSETGYISETHFLKALDLFAESMKSIELSTSPLILLADNLNCHRTLPVLQKAKQLHIQLQMLTPNASHFLQPLDDTLFAAFKIILTSTYDTLESALTSLSL